ncbi:MAG: virulence RhuM family protein [Paludibacteraceae bacterium]|nr:virulence RhuM family protein [Paludibacteraceae bacterium]
MKDEIVPYNPNEESVVVYRTEDNSIQLQVKLEHESVWLTQDQMAELFDRDRTVIGRHIRNIFSEGELDESLVCAKFALPKKYGRHDGLTQDVEVTIYNLDVIISVGYRVKSKRGTQFRQWANRIIKEYLLKGYAINQQLLAIQRQIDSRFEKQDNRLLAIESELSDHQEKIDFFVRTSLPPVEQVFFEGEFFEARVILERIIKTAQKRVIIIDAYVDAATFEMLDVRAKGVTADIYSDGEHKSLRDTHNAAAGVQPINTHKWSTASHDRWLIVDDSLYHCGHSVKDLGKKLSAIMLMGESPEAILNHVS